MFKTPNEQFIKSVFQFSSESMKEVLPILDYEFEIYENPSQSGDDFLFDDSIADGNEETTVSDYFHTGKDFSQNYGQIFACY